MRFDLKIIIAMILKLAHFIDDSLDGMNVAETDYSLAHFADSESCLIINSENSFSCSFV